MHALCLPLGASVSLLIMFFFFDSMQMLFAVCTASKYSITYRNHGVYKIKPIFFLFPQSLPPSR